MESFSTSHLMQFILSKYGRALVIFCVKFRVKSKIYFDELDILTQAEIYLPLGFFCIETIFETKI